MKQILIGLLAGIAITLLSQRCAHAQYDSSCNDLVVNDQGASNADITVDGTAGGVEVAAPWGREGRCTLLIRNSGLNPMRCGPTSGPHAIVVTATAGDLLNAGEWRRYGFESWPQFNCIRTTGSSTTANVTESRKGGVK